MVAKYDSTQMCKILSMKQRFEIDLAGCCMDEVVEEWEKYKQKYNPNIKKNLFTLKKHMKELQEIAGIRIMPWHITDLFYGEFVNYMYSCGLKGSTINFVCTQIGCILDWAAKHNCTVSSTSRNTIKEKYTKTRVALTMDEVSLIYHFNIDTLSFRPQRKKRLDRVRDMFVLSCNLGQRYSDMMRISEECFDRNVFRITQKKTQNRARVDIDKLSLDAKTVYEILEKYDYNPPCSGDLTNFDKDLKDLLKSIGGRFNDMIRVDTKVKGLMTTTKIPKWKMISSHTGRRTFATVNVLRGFTEAEIRRATGHLSSSSFEKYICYEEE